MTQPGGALAKETILGEPLLGQTIHPNKTSDFKKGAA